MPYFLWEITAKQTRFRLGNNWKHTGIVSRRGRDVMWRINRRRHGLFICAFNRFRIKGPPLPRHADWQEIARHPVRQPKNRYELRRRDKIVSLALPYPPPPPSSLFSPLLGRDRRYCANPTRRQLFLAGYGERRASMYAHGEILCIDTIELSYRKSLFQPSRSQSRRERERTIRLGDINLGWKLI